MTLQELLSMEVISWDSGGGPVKVSPEFRVSVQNINTLPNGKTVVHVIIHADGHDSHTLDLYVSNDTVSVEDNF